MENKRVSLMRRRRHGVGFGVVTFFLVLFFQNCDGGFHFDPTTSQLASLGGVGNSQFRLTTYSPTGTVVPEGQSFEGGLEYKIVASGDNIAGATVLWQLSTNTGSCILKAGTTPEVRYVLCSKSGVVAIQASAVWDDGSTTVLASQRTTSELIIDLCGPSSSVRTVFRIANGTGANAWNTSASPLVAFVGQTIRICNDDAVSHQLRTAGTPCVQQAAAMPKGQFYDCQVQSINGKNATTNLFDGLYDNISGPSAAFYVRPYDGVALYADVTKSTSGAVSCASCHGAYGPASTRKGRSFQQIKAAIATVPAMAVFQNQTLLTDDEIRAIAFSLSLL